MKIQLKLLFTILLAFLASCQIDHKIASVEIEDNFNSAIDQMRCHVNVCLEEELGYSGVTLKFYFETKDGRTFNFSDDIYTSSTSGSNTDKKCFELVSSTWLHRHSTEEDEKDISSIRAGNIEKLKIEVWSDGVREKLSERTFTNL